MFSFIHAYAKKFILPRGFVLVTDLFITSAGFLIAYILRLNFLIDQVSFGPVIMQLTSIVLPLYLITFLCNGSYKGIIRHSSIEDAGRLAVAVSEAMCAVFFVAAITHTDLMASYWFLPYSVVFIHATVISVMLMGFRLIIRSIYHIFIMPGEGCRKVLIFGAGQVGQITLGVLESAGYSKTEVIGFIDDDKALIGKRLLGKPIYSEKYALGKLLKRLEIHEIILAVDRGNIKPERRKTLFDRCLVLGITIREVPPFKDWMNGRLRSQQIRDVNIEDLLGRDPIWLNLNKISKGLKDSVALVTGAAGSIGSEIVRQLMTFELRTVILLDQAESALYDLQNELLRSFPGVRFEVIIGSVTESYRMRSVFKKYKPEYVFNAAAYKHVPLMEASPAEAIRVNIGGTLLLANLSVEFEVKKFVMISTDKAVNPSNVMGASKRICELYIQGLAQSDHKNTQFITTRFGNVLGSNGSVVPLFRKQIEAGGPVTVTHREIIRYFMTIHEACQLVLEAGFMGQGGEIYVFDMGEPVKIYDLAVKMISLAGLKPEVDIPIQFTGLRPGEKLFEELLTDKENMIPTHHPKIMVAKVRTLNFEIVKRSIGSLLQASKTESEAELVRRMKLLVPEFISQNSVYSVFDKPRSLRKQKPEGSFLQSG
ncbi:MAG: polysaccharide biosynthesis protein [Mangrovibacterium sp.]